MFQITSTKNKNKNISYTSPLYSRHLNAKRSGKEPHHKAIKLSRLAGQLVISEADHYMYDNKLKTLFLLNSIVLP